VGVITRIGNAPGVRRLVRKRPVQGEVRESPDDDDREPMWCLECRREVLFDLTDCPDCGGKVVTTQELARRTGGLPSRGPGPADW
jgi:hypothetical protein